MVESLLVSVFFLIWDNTPPDYQDVKNASQEMCVFGGSQEQRCVFSRRLHPLGELPHPGQEAVGQGGAVVARVQDVGLAALAFLQPHEVRAGGEEGAGALSVQLQDHARDAQHHPHRDHDVV